MLMSLQVAAHTGYTQPEFYTGTWANVLNPRGHRLQYIHILTDELVGQSRS